MTTLIFVRHGESEANKRDIFAGNLNVSLSERGLRQAEMTASYIRENYTVDKVYASDLERAYNTGKCISDACGVEIIKDELLREIFAGIWEGMTFSELFEKYPEEVEKWNDDIGNSACPEGETVSELATRILKEVIKIAAENDGKQIVIATHATPVRAMQCIASGFDISEMKNIAWASNASVTEIHFEDGKWNLIKASEDSHLTEVTKLNL